MASHKFNEIYVRCASTFLAVPMSFCAIQSNLLQLSCIFDVAPRGCDRIEDVTLIDFKYTLFVITILTQCDELVNECVRNHS